MITFARLLLSPGQSTLLSGLFETDWDYGRAIHFLASSAIPQQESLSINTAAAPGLLVQQGVVSAADVAISADWAFQLYNTGNIINRLFLDLAASGQEKDGRHAITGSSYADEIVNSGSIEGSVSLGAGNDLLDGRLGLILGAADGADGDDTLLSGAAAETLLGGDGQDWLDGGAGADSLSGGAGANRIFAGTGNDSLTSGDGDDKLNGEAGDDWLQSDRGNDSLSGGDGADTLIGGDGNDTLAGGDGDDLLEAGDDQNQASGGNGNDTISAWGGGDRLFGDAGDDLLEVIGGAFSLSGGAGADTLTVWEDWVANDVLNGGDGADSLNAGAGDDTLLGGAGADTMIGGAGDDVILAGGTSLQDILSLFTL
jgi:Ca2+-binding RTX toxin-like protein